MKLIKVLPWVVVALTLAYCVRANADEPLYTIEPGVYQSVIDSLCSQPKPTGPRGSIIVWYEWVNGVCTPKVEVVQ